MEMPLNYNSAFAELQKLVQQIENEDIQLDTLADNVKQANELINYCEMSLRTIERDVSEQQ
jgi:exodeoxyribonuclease VII small subunit